MLDGTDFNVGTVIYGQDDAAGVQFSDDVDQSSNVPKTSFGANIVGVQGADLYEKGEISLTQLKQVVMNEHKYVGGGNDKYIVTGVYDDSHSITYDRKNPKTAASQVYAKGFVKNPYAGTASFSSAMLCVKLSEGGSNAKTGYLRAVVFTLKKIS